MLYELTRLPVLSCVVLSCAVLSCAAGTTPSQPPPGPELVAAPASEPPPAEPAGSGGPATKTAEAASVDPAPSAEPPASESESSGSPPATGPTTPPGRTDWADCMVTGGCLATQPSYWAEREAQSRRHRKLAELAEAEVDERFPQVTEPMSYLPEDESINQFAKRSRCMDPEQVRRLLRDGSGAVQIREAALVQDAFPERPYWRVLWATGNAGLCQEIFVVNDQGQIRDQRTFEVRGHVRVGNIVADQQGLDLKEIIVNKILGNALSTYPEWWEVFRVNKWGKLVTILEHEREFSSGSKYRVWKSLFRFEFERDEFRAIPLVPENRQPEVFKYHPVAGRYIPTPETRARKAAEKREAGKREAGKRNKKSGF